LAAVGPGPWASSPRAHAGERLQLWIDGRPSPSAGGNWRAISLRLMVRARCRCFGRPRSGRAPAAPSGLRFASFNRSALSPGIVSRGDSAASSAPCRRRNDFACPPAGRRRVAPSSLRPRRASAPPGRRWTLSRAAKDLVEQSAPTPVQPGPRKEDERAADVPRGVIPSSHQGLDEVDAPRRRSRVEARRDPRVLAPSSPHPPAAAGSRPSCTYLRKGGLRELHPFWEQKKSTICPAEIPLRVLQFQPVEFVGFALDHRQTLGGRMPP